MMRVDESVSLEKITQEWLKSGEEKQKTRQISSGENKCYYK